MNPEKTKIRYEASETKINVRNVALGLGAVAALGLAAKYGLGAESPSAPELSQRTDKQISFVLEEGGSVDGSAFAHAQEVSSNLSDTQRGQIVESSREAARANGIPQPGDGFTLNIGEYDGKPGDDFKVTPEGVSPETENSICRTRTRLISKRLIRLTTSRRCAICCRRLRGLALSQAEV